MSKDLFTPVNYDEFQKDLSPAADKALIVELVETPARAVELINSELQKIQLGTSKMTPHAIQVKEGSTPFLHALRTFSVEPTVNTAVALVALAKQDFSATFGRFVESLVSPLFKGKK